MLLKIGVVLAAVPMALLALVAATGLLVVDVREGGPNGHHFIVPVPLILAQAAAGFVPADKVRLPLDRPALREYFPVAEKAIQALADGPDGELVRVEERGQSVVVSKAGDTLRVRVKGRDEDVSANVPLSAALELMRQCRDGRVVPGDLVAALRQARFTRLAEVHDGDDHVRVSVW
jgi:hypothetical protein